MIDPIIVPTTAQLLCQETITFGKYKGGTISQVLKDRGYCDWLKDQEWFSDNYPYLFKRVKEYNPRTYFIRVENDDSNFFLDTYEFFNLIFPTGVKLPLSQCEITCYTYYRDQVEKLKQQVYDRMENEMSNIYDIKAPTGWLKCFEKIHGIPRIEFKKFISEYDLLNIPYIIERIKKEGGLEYKGARSFIIAKERSLVQEAWWENILKERYNDDISVQFKYKNCIFDMLNIKTNTIFECKLGLKDFDANQHTKYKTILNTYRIIYLISQDLVIDTQCETLYTTDVIKYEKYVDNICNLKNPSYLDTLISDFDIMKHDDLSTLFN